MNKRGFTLVEILGVVVILSAIIVLVFPAVNDILDLGTKTTTNKQLNKILNATYDLTLKDLSLLPENNTKYITLNQLKKEGLIETNIKNPENREKFQDNLVISIKKVGTNFKYDKKYSILEGSYLYTIEQDLIKEENNPKRPIITISQDKTEDFMKELNLGDNFDNFEYSAVDSKGYDLTNEVVYNITRDSKNVSYINTKVAGIYHINYTVVDKNGYSNLLIASIVVVDNVKPELTIPENVTLGIDATKYNLMDGVICEDNSENCDVTINGEITFGKKGKYIIEYIAKDPTGNTSTEKRVITIE